MYYYQRLKDLREDADKSQAEIARILEISQQHYSQYERGERELPMHLFIVLANYYNASLVYMGRGGKCGMERGTMPPLRVKTSCPAEG